MDQNVPYRLTYLNTLPLLGGNVWEGLREGLRWRRCATRGRLWFQKTHAIPLVSFSLVVVSQDVSSWLQLHIIPACLLPWLYYLAMIDWAPTL